MPHATWPGSVPDSRVDSFLEARRCMALARKQTVEQPEFWANLLGGLVNITAASVPDSVVVAVWEYDEWEKERNAAHLRDLRDKLGGK